MQHNQIINEQEAAIPDNINLKIVYEEKFPLQDYLNHGWTYSNRSTIRLLENNLGGSKFNLDFLILVRHNPFRGLFSGHPHDHIKKLKDLMGDDYNRCKLFSFSLVGDARR